MNAPAPTAAAPAPHPLREFLRRIGPAGPVALLATCMPAIGAMAVIGFTPMIASWLVRGGGAGIVIFVIAFALLGGFALVPNWISTSLAGWTFKFALGFPAVMTGLAGAAMIGYSVAHRIVRHRVREVIHEHPRWEVVRDALVDGSTIKVIGIVTLLRLSPVMPFSTTNVLLASCEVRPLPFLIGTILGVAPRAAAWTFVSARAHSLDLRGSNSAWFVAGGIVLTLIGAAVITIAAKHALDRATRVP